MSGPFLPWFRNKKSFGWFECDIWLIVLCLLSLSIHLWARSLSSHLRTLCSFPLQLWAILAVEQGAPGALYLGGLQETIYRLHGPQAKKSTVVVALMVCHKLFDYFRRTMLSESLIPGIQSTTLKLSYSNIKQSMIFKNVWIQIQTLLTWSQL